MAMNMTGEVQLPASREVVWAMLSEPSQTLSPADQEGRPFRRRDGIAKSNPN